LSVRKLGATVHSFDYDIDSVNCTKKMKEQYWSEDGCWVDEQGDVLDETDLKNLASFDYIYSWGVLHHTGEMWNALRNAVLLVKNKGKLFIAIYNNQGRQ